MKRICFENNRLGIEGVDINDKGEILAIHPSQNSSIILTNMVVVHAELKTTLQVKGKRKDDKTIFTIFVVNAILPL